MPGDRWAAAHRALRPPVRESRFWAVQAMVVGLAVIHLVTDWVSATPQPFPTGIPVALLLAPVSYAALRYGLAGSAAKALWATLSGCPTCCCPVTGATSATTLPSLCLWSRWPCSWDTT